MKKTFITAIALAAALSLSACGDKSQNKDNIKQEAPKATEEVTLPDVVSEYTKVDAFDKIIVDISGAYPGFTFFFNTSESIYNKKIDYDCTIKTADLEKIVIEAKADYSKYENDLREMGYEFETDTKIYEISTDEIKTHLLREEQLTDENLNEIISHVTRYCDPEYIVNNKIYALMPKDNVFLEDYKCTDKLSTGVSSSGYLDYLLQRIPESQFFMITNAPSNSPFDESIYYEVHNFDVEFENGKVSYCGYPQKDGIKDEYGRIVEEELDETNIDDYFDRLLSRYQDEGYTFEVKEIPLPIE